MDFKLILANLEPNWVIVKKSPYLPNMACFQAKPDASFNSQYSESESFYCSIVWQQSSWKDGVHFISWEDHPFINRNPKVLWFNNHFSETEILYSRIVGLPVIVEGWVSYHSWDDNPFIKDGLNTHFSGSETFHRRIVCQLSTWKDGFHFIHGRITP